jgi:hypothetical protein
MIVYTITVLDFVADPVLGNRRTPAIFTTLEKARSVVKNNEQDLSDGVLYQYAVIEETHLNVIRPDVFYDTKKYWFKYNSALDEFVECDPKDIPYPANKLSGFGIG